MAIDPTLPVTLQQLEDHLLASADLFRGLTDVEVQRDYVLALLFFKRACDMYATETARAVEALGGTADAAAIVAANPDAYHAVRIPKGAFWSEATDVDAHELGSSLNEALRAISLANPAQLTTVFDYTDFNNRKALPAEHLADLISHFEELGALTEDRVPPDMLGQAYEWLIAQFASMAGKAGGEFYTPAPVGRLGAKLLAPPPSADVYDPTCGSGGLLLQVRDEAFSQHGDAANALALRGQELKPTTWAIARMNMLLHGAGDAAVIEQGDTLFAPAFLVDGRVEQFDLIIANPPFSSKNWGHDKLLRTPDPFGRITHVPPKKHGEMAFVQHMVASLGDHGRMVVVLPNGALSRGSTEAEVRREIITADLVEAVIQLPKDMFYGTQIPACYLVLSKEKPASRAGRVLFIDASREFTRVDTKNVLQNDHITKVVEAYRADDAMDGFSAWATTDDIRDRRYSLSVKRYVTSSDAAGEALPSLSEAIAAVRAARSARTDADEAVAELLDELDAHVGA